MVFLEPIQWFVFNLVSDGYPIWLITSSPYYSCKIVGQIPSEMLFPESLGDRRSKKIPIGSACRQRQTCFALFYKLNFRNKQNGQTMSNLLRAFFSNVKARLLMVSKSEIPNVSSTISMLVEGIHPRFVIGTPICLCCLWQSSQNVAQNVSLSHLHTFESPVNLTLVHQIHQLTLIKRENWNSTKKFDDFASELHLHG